MKLPKLNLPEGLRNRLRFDVPQSAMAKWDSGLRAADESDNTISIFDIIGEDFWTGEGVTAKRIAAALRKIGSENPVTVLMNSPGGDLFEGLAIYNLLREHKGQVTVKVLALAASAASVIAMAGDRIEIARAGFFMVHDTWILAIGNRHDLREFAEWLEPFDRAMADVYAAKTGHDVEEMQALMDAETWIGGSEAVDAGFADALLPSDEVGKTEARAEVAAARQVELALRRAGLPANQAKKLLSELKSRPRDATGSGARDATELGLRDAADEGQPARELLDGLKAFSVHQLIGIKS